MNKSTCDILIYNGQIITMDLERRIYRTGAVAITGSRIVEVGTDADLRQRFDAKETIDAEGGIVHPGFIDAHNHILHTSCRGVGNVRDANPSPVNFATWKAGVTDEDEAAATAMASLEMLRSGFTMFIEPGSLFSTQAGAEAVERVGMRALFAPLYLWDRSECFDAVPSLISPSLMARAPIDLDRSLGQLDVELHRNRDPEALVRGYIFVYGAGTASPELLQAAHACARDNNVPFQLHAGYVPGEPAIYRAINGTSHIMHLQELGVLDEHTVIVPCKRTGRRGRESGPGIGLPDSMVPGCLFLARIRRKCELQDGAAIQTRNPRLSRHRRRYRMHSGWDHARCTLRVTNLCGPSFPRGVTRNADHQRGLGSRNGCGAGKLGIRQARGCRGEVCGRS